MNLKYFAVKIVLAPAQSFRAQSERTRKEVDNRRQCKKDFSTNPLDGSELDTINILGEINVEHGKFLWSHLLA